MSRPATSRDVFPDLPSNEPARPERVFIAPGWTEYKIIDNRTGNMTRAYSHEEVTDRIGRLAYSTLRHKNVVGYSPEFPHGTYVSWTA